DAALAMLQLDVVSLTAVTHVFAQDMRTRGRGEILLVASMLAYQGVEKFAVYAAAKAYVLRLGEALHRELKRDGVAVTVLAPGMSDTGFATAAQQKITPALKLLMMPPPPVVRAGIRALQAKRISVVPGWANKAFVMFTRATPRCYTKPFSLASWVPQMIAATRTPRRSRRDDRVHSNDNHHVRTETQIRQPVRPGACKPTGGFQPVLQIKSPRAARRYRMRHCPAGQNSDGRLSRRCR